MRRGSTHTDIYTNCSVTLSECSSLNTGRNNKRGRGGEGGGRGGRSERRRRQVKRDIRETRRRGDRRRKRRRQMMMRLKQEGGRRDKRAEERRRVNERRRKTKLKWERKRAAGCFSLMKIKLRRRKQDRRRSVDLCSTDKHNNHKVFIKTSACIYTWRNPPPPSSLLPPPTSSPAGRLQRSLVGRRRLLCGEQVAPLSAAPVVRSAALIFISDSGSHKSKSRGARGATTRSFNFLLWED